jgi:hypothetical protein
MKKKSFSILCMMLAVAFLSGCSLFKISTAELPPIPHATVQPAVTPAPALSPVRQMVSFEEKLFIAAGILCLLASGALFYFGQIVAGVKVCAAGIILPIFAVWFSAHFAIVIAAILIVLAITYIVQNAALEKKIIAWTEKQASTVEKNL